MLVYSPRCFPLPITPPMSRALARRYPSSALLPGFVLSSPLLRSTSFPTSSLPVSSIRSSDIPSPPSPNPITSSSTIALVHCCRFVSLLHFLMSLSLVCIAYIIAITRHTSSHARQSPEHNAPSTITIIHTTVQSSPSSFACFIFHTVRLYISEGYP
ncbi:hypothetical protein L226DRAFT_244480 [Lentinus tigrinus ALCF2SS1-7]|uniref:Uncharacterized protein n=1 Tax=Lentinus tigrinus ALCF2SS1-6 TaxID=1328759 RepID=A0A5C2SNE5_9APHY|nr:hypothetical protein L227DRAFT_209515 [Lentinus tigrinus ALCF2SS1-6]RPD79225.1 hypothetical protein L226DRAFT_244480 [Lentinus tigrinus ALCF2SS1-7]